MPWSFTPPSIPTPRWSSAYATVGSPAAGSSAVRVSISKSFSSSSGAAEYLSRTGAPIENMGFLADKKILITGLLSNRSIAYGIAQACRREGATLAFTYVNDDLKERVTRLAGEFGSVPVLPCDVASDEQIGALFDALKREWGALDGLLHSIAFAPREALAGDFLNGLSRAAFATAHDISSYSFAALAKGARPLMQGHQSALLTLTDLGSTRVLENYNVIGLAKASLQA